MTPPEDPLGSAAWPPTLPRPHDATLLAGGWVGTTWRARLADGSVVVVKQTPYPADAEAEGLGTLAAAGVPTPAVLGHAGGTLVLEHVAGEPDWAAVGRAVARLHGVTGPAFGWHRDNHAGRFDQPNGWLDDWPAFFVERRVRPHLTDPHLPADVRDRLERACAGAIQELLPTDAVPVLTHGDLWPGNVVAGRWVVDPEVSYADAELDLANMLMSVRDPFPPAFWAAYEAVRPIPAGLAQRRRVLELHHRLLHVRHFGSDHVAAVAEILDHHGW